MRSRRLPLVVVLLLALAGLVVVATDHPVPLDASFADVPAPGTPHVQGTDVTTRSWYCPGMPTAGESTGEIVITNPTARPLAGRYTLYVPAGDAVTRPLGVDPFGRAVIDVEADVTDPDGARYVSALVEIDGGQGVVEQRAIHPAGTAVAPCTTSTSSSWYFADGYTVGGSSQVLLLTNPSPGRAIVDIGFVTQAGARSPTSFQGFVVDSQAVAVIDLAEAGVQDEPLLAVKVVAKSGRVVAAREQHMIAGGRLGYTMTLGAPSLDDQWFFADGETGEGITETYVLYNPTDEDVDADVVYLGVPFDEQSPPPEPVTLTVPANGVTTYGTAASDLPAGRHGAAIATLSTDSLVVERVLTRPAGPSVATTVQMGLQSAFLSSRWYLPVGVALPIEGAIVVLNSSYLDGTVTVNAFGPAGEQPVPGLEGLPIGANAILVIDLTDPVVVGASLVVQADVPVVVERRPERSADLRGRTSALGVPQVAAR